MPNPLKLPLIANQPVVALMLPKSPLSTQNPVSLRTREPLQRPKPPLANHMRSNQHMDMVRHDDERVQLIPLEERVPGPNRVQNNTSNRSLRKISRPIQRMIQHPIHSNKSLTRIHPSHRKHPIYGQTSLQPKSNKLSRTHGIPVRQTAFKLPHQSNSIRYHRKISRNAAPQAHPRISNRETLGLQKTFRGAITKHG
jgi:hypothetical protein